MSNLTVRINKTAHRTLREMAETTGESLQAVLAKAIEEYRRKKFLEEANAAYAALRQNPKAWREEQRERKVWDRTLSDGLETD